MATIEQDFDQFIRAAKNSAQRDAGYDAVLTGHLIADKGSVEAVRYLLDQPEVSGDFLALWELERTDLTIEAQLVRKRERFQSLFSQEQLQKASHRVQEYSNRFKTLGRVAKRLRDLPQDNRLVLIYGYNGTGKTRLCSEFKSIGQTKNADGETTSQDTLYFSAYTEDLFSWDNDLQNNHARFLRLNQASKFFQGLVELEMNVKIRQILDRYADFDFFIDDQNWQVTFFRERDADNDPIPIKVSRGEENLFIWCWFLANLQLAIDDDGSGPFAWVKNVYIDDPISSLDEQNAVAVAVELSSMIKDPDYDLKTVISTHHPLFFNVLYNELNRTKGRRSFFFCRALGSTDYRLIDVNDTPFFHHVANLMELHEAARSGQVFTYHFNMLRVIIEKTASFLGYDGFEHCVVREEDDPEGVLHKRYLNLLSHGKYSLYEPRLMLDENKGHFLKMLSRFTEEFAFNPKHFPPLTAEPAVEAMAPAVGHVEAEAVEAEVVVAPEGEG
jgi:hypothetical protein